MKYCSTCKFYMDESNFNKNRSRKDGLNSICKECSKNRSKKYYKENKEKHINYVQERCRKFYKKNKSEINSVKYNSEGCVCCGEKEICCLDFHHRDPSKKENEVSALLRLNATWKRIQEEIDKCVIVCSNCHRKLHKGILTLSV